MLFLKRNKSSKNVSALNYPILPYRCGSLLLNICPRLPFVLFFELPPHFERHTRCPFPLPPSFPYWCGSALAYKTWGGGGMDRWYPQGCFCVAAVRPAGRLCVAVCVCLMCSVTLPRRLPATFCFPSLIPQGTVTRGRAHHFNLPVTFQHILPRLLCTVLENQTFKTLVVFSPPKLFRVNCI